MKVPLTVADYLRRAELVYPDRIGVVDEPDQPAASWGALTYREVAERGPRPGRGPRRARDRPRRAGGHRQPELRPPAHQLLRRERLRAHPRARELPAQRRRGGLHRRALGGLDPAGRPGAGRGARGRDGQAAVRARRRERRRAVPLRRGARAVDARRGRHRHHQLHQRHHGPPQRSASSPIATSGSTPPPSAGRWASTTATCTSTPSRSSTATAGGWCTRSPAWAGSTSCCARSTAQRSCGGSTSTG